MSQPDYQSLRLARIRVSKINPTTGAPLVGASNGYVSNSQIQLQVGTNITTGDTGIQKNGNGDVCASFEDSDRLKNVTLALDLCSADAILRSFLTGGSLFTDATNSNIPFGYQAPSTAGTLNVPVCLEAWTKAWDGTQQATSVTAGAGSYWHWVFPWSTFVEDTTTLSNGIHTFPLKGKSVENAAITANGPFNDWGTILGANGGVTRCYGYFLDSTTLPAVSDARIAVPAGS